MHSHIHRPEEKQLVSFWLAGAFVGAIFIVDSYIIRYVTGQGNSVAAISAFIGALILV